MHKLFGACNEHHSTSSASAHSSDSPSAGPRACTRTLSAAKCLHSLCTCTSSAAMSPALALQVDLFTLHFHFTKGECTRAATSLSCTTLWCVCHHPSRAVYGLTGAYRAKQHTPRGCNIAGWGPTVTLHHHLHQGCGRRKVCGSSLCPSLCPTSCSRYFRRSWMQQRRVGSRRWTRQCSNESFSTPARGCMLGVTPVRG